MVLATTAGTMAFGFGPIPRVSNISSTGSAVTLTWTSNQGSNNTTIEGFSNNNPHYHAYQYGYFEAEMKWDVVIGAYPVFG